jgi:hypothetical protein
MVYISNLLVNICKVASHNDKSRWFVEEVNAVQRAGAKNREGKRMRLEQNDQVSSVKMTIRQAKRWSQSVFMSRHATCILAPVLYPVTIIKHWQISVVSYRKMRQCKGRPARFRLWDSDSNAWSSAFQPWRYIKHEQGIVSLQIYARNDAEDVPCVDKYAKWLTMESERPSKHIK